MKLKSAILLAVFLLCIVGCDKLISYFQDNEVRRVIDPSFPVVDLNERAKNNKILLVTTIEDSIVLVVEGPVVLKDKIDDIRSDCEKALSFIKSYYGDKTESKITLVFIDGRNVTNYSYRFPRKNGFTHLILYNQREEILSSFSLYSLVRDIASNINIFKDISDGNCFEVGISQYVALQFLEKTDEERYKKRAASFAKDFCDSEIRKNLWTWYDDNGLKNISSLSKEQLHLYYDEIDKYYRASGGIYLYLEALLGRETCNKAIKTLINTDFICQDDVFFKKFTEIVGIDIRKEKDEKIKEVLSRYLN